LPRWHIELNLVGLFIVFLRLAWHTSPRFRVILNVSNPLNPHRTVTEPQPNLNSTVVLRHWNAPCAMEPSGGISSSPVEFKEK
jgi:hypothetical protein